MATMEDFSYNPGMQSLYTPADDYFANYDFAALGEAQFYTQFREEENNMLDLTTQYYATQPQYSSVRKAPPPPLEYFSLPSNYTTPPPSAPLSSHFADNIMFQRGIDERCQIALDEQLALHHSATSSFSIPGTVFPPTPNFSETHFDVVHIANNFNTPTLPSNNHAALQSPCHSQHNDYPVNIPIFSSPDYEIYCGPKPNEMVEFPLSPRTTSATITPVPVVEEAPAPVKIKRTRRRKVISPEEKKRRKIAFLERNRMAANKCRRKKKSEVVMVEDAFVEARRRNEELRGELGMMLREVEALRESVRCCGKIGMGMGTLGSSFGSDCGVKMEMGMGMGMGMGMVEVC